MAGERRVRAYGLRVFRARWLAVAAVFLSVGCRGGSPTTPAPAPEASPARTSALTLLTRTGWVASASATGGTNVAANAIDGSATTRWSTGVNQANGQFFQVDMLAPQAFAEIRLDTTPTATDFPRAYQVTVSNDGTTWSTPVATGTNTAIVLTIAFAPQAARFVRVTQTGTASNFWSIYDFNVFGTALSRTGWVATGSSTGGTNVAANAIDGSATTRWSTTGAQTGQSFQVDMGSPQSFNQVTLDAGTTTTNFPRGYQLFVSNDGTTWGTAIATGTGTTAFINITFPFQRARHVRITQTATNATVWSIQELNVCGQPTVQTTLSRNGWVASASSTGSTNVAANALDGSATTRWSSSGAQTGQFFQVDMGTLRTFTQLTLDAGTTTANFPRGYQVNISTNGTTFTSVATGTGTTALVTINLPAQTARYIRVNQTATNTTVWSIQEMNVSGPTVSRPGWVATASSTGGTDVAANALDGNATTRWSTAVAQANGQSFQFDMGAPQTFNQITLDAGTSTGNFPRGYQAFVSTDGVNFGTAVATGTGSTQLVTINFLTKTARFARIVQTGTATNVWSIHELNVAQVAQPCDQTTCTASDSCHTVGTCDPNTGICSNPTKAVGAACDDGNLCTQTDTCSATFVCVGANPKVCTASDQCHDVGVCAAATGVCSNPAKTNGTTCNDGSLCTQTDTCQTGVCTGANPKVCTASDQCHDIGVCAAGTGACSNPAKANGASCSDGSACTTGESCQAGVCTGGAAVTCTTDQCHTIGACVAATGCPAPVAKAPGTSCSDGNVCNGAETCNAAGACVAGAPPTCAAADACHTVGSCVPATGCPAPVAKAAGTSCSDGNACNGAETCNAAGACVAGAPPTCAAADACHTVGSCNPATGACVYPPAADGTACVDSNRCTQNDTCLAGTCIGGALIALDHSNPCTTYSCDPATGFAAVPTNEGGSCDDGNSCTDVDICRHGTCQPGATKASCLAAGATNYPPIVEIPPLGVSNQALAINDSGDVVGADYQIGWPNVPERAFRYTETGGTVRVAAQLPGSTAHSINAAGVVAGDSGNGGPPIIESLAGVLTVYSPPNFGPGIADSINDNNEFVGGHFPAGNPFGAQAFLYSPITGPKELGHLEGPQFNGSSGAYGIDQFHRIVGRSDTFTQGGHAFLYVGSGPMQDLNSLAGTVQPFSVLTIARATNGTMIVGDGYLPDGTTRGFRYRDGVPVEAIGVLSERFPANNFSHANAINQNGDVVGYVSQSDVATRRAFLYTADQRLYSLNDFVDPSSGWLLEYATGINVNNEIVGWGMRAGAMRAFKIKMPRLDTCPVSTNVCQQGTGTRNPASGVCVYPPAPDGTACVDSNRCTENDTCLAGTCMGGALVALDHSNPCTTYSCDPATGIATLTTNEGGSCDDGNSCTDVDICRHGTCQPGATKASCLAAGATNYPPIVELPPLRYNSQAMAINDAGEVVGLDYDLAYPVVPERAFKHTDAAGTVVVAAGLPASTAYALNSSGVVAGGAGNGHLPLTETPDGVSSLFPGVGFGPGIAYGITDDAELAGAHFPPGGTIGAEAFRYSPLTGLTNLGALLGPQFNGISGAYAIDRLHRVVGTSITFAQSGLDNGKAFLYVGSGPMQDLTDLATPGQAFARLTAANASNGTMIVGYGVRPDGSIHGFRYHDGGVVDDIGTLPGYPANTTSIAKAINAHGDVVGYVSGIGYRPFLYTNDGRLLSLNDFVDPNSGWSLQFATGINVKNEVVGWGMRHGVSRAFKMQIPDLSPCPTSPDACKGAGTRNLSDGRCVYPSAANGVACSDGSACTMNDTCLGGTCVSGQTVVLDQSNPCVTEACDPLQGIVRTAAGEGGACQDGNSCTVGDSCRSGICQPGATIASSCTAAGGHYYAPIVEISPPTGSTSEARDVSDPPSGVSQVIGYVHNGDASTSHAFRYSDGSPVTTIATVSSAYGINASGLIVGGLGGGGGAFSQPLGGDVTPFLIGPSQAWDVNDNGQSAGFYYPGGVGPQAFRYYLGVAKPLGTLPGPQFSGATDAHGIDAIGRVVGYAAYLTPRSQPLDTGHAVIFTDTGANGEMKDLNDLVAAGSGFTTLSVAQAINSRYVVGYGVRSDNSIHGFRYQVDTNTAYDIGSLPGVPGSPQTTLEGLNARGDAVGHAFQNQGGDNVAFVYTNAGKFYNLNDFVDPASGWRLEVASAINNRSEVVGYGTKGNARRAFKMTLPDTVTNPSIEDSLSLRIDGVVDMGNGAGPFVAVFGYNNIAGASIAVPLGAQNSVTVNDSIIADPQPRPPTVFLPYQPGQHPGTFLPRFNAGETVTWTVAGHFVTASQNTNRLATSLVGTSGASVSVGGTTVIVQPDLSSYTKAPDPSVVQPDPQNGGDFHGTLAGQLSVGRSGASIYTVPINIPPGVAGVAPNLSLVYTSQGIDGIAGQGWDLGGLSLIHRCPSNLVQDGFAEPLDLSDGQSSAGTGPHDALCIDGKKFFYRRDTGSAFEYETELKDFALISQPYEFVDGVATSTGFRVITKAGEMRFYGSRAESRIVLPRPPDPFFPNQPNTAVAAWALDRVEDAWGNYYELHYNKANEGPHETNGFRITEIDYTGHAAVGLTNGGGETSAVTPFYSVVFDYYDSRTDPRTVRFGPSTLPRNRLLKSITTPAGTYGLEYDTPDPTLPSRLHRITYCSATSPSQCLVPLEFDWDFGEYKWEENGSYPLPVSIATSPASPGTVLVDLNGDGRVDLIQSKEGMPAAAWENNGAGWTPRPDWALPAHLTSQDGTPASASLADINGDGLLDLIATSGQPSTLSVWLNRTRQGLPWDLSPGLSTAATSGDTPLDFSTPLDRVVDMNGDGRADIVRFLDKMPSLLGPDTLEVLLSTGTGWTNASSLYTVPAGTQLGTFFLRDVNRDGMVDLMSGIPKQGTNTYVALLNTINLAHGDFATIWRSKESQLDFDALSFVGWDFADVDGDGMQDALASFSRTRLVIPTCKDDFKIGLICARVYDGSTGHVAFATGRNFTLDGTAPYAASLSIPAVGNTVLDVTFVDLNADGLADYVRQDGATSFINTGSAWSPLTTPASHLPIFPRKDGADGVKLVDLDGDGVVDLVQSNANINAQGQRISRAWLNKFRPPVISHFPNGTPVPNGTAVKTALTYTVITTKEAYDGATYSDSPVLSPGTTYLPMPLRVVSSMSTDDGIGGISTSTYRYSSIRGSAFGRGPQGFRDMTVDQPSGTLAEPSTLATVTTFAQAYPYTGLVVGTIRYNGGLISTTDTQYCDKILSTEGEVCTPLSGAAFAAKTSLFIYPIKTADRSFLRTSAASELRAVESILTTTETRYDSHANPITTAVTMERFIGATVMERYKKDTQNAYGGPNTPEETQGRLTHSTSSSQKLLPVDGQNGTIRHTTDFAYDQLIVPPSWALVSSGYQQVVMVKKKVEPGAAAAPDPGPNPSRFEIHTAYGYDRFGNVTITTVCDDSFDTCTAGAPSPFVGEFRTSRVSYDVADFNAPSGGGLLTRITAYGNGRYPVKTTNALGQSEYTAFDPLNGRQVQQTGPNGIHTCYQWDEFGRASSETARCGANPVTTTFRYQLVSAQDPFRPTLATIMSITDPPVGGPTRVYMDSLGRKIGVLTRHAGGGFSEILTEYDGFGRITAASRPFLPGEQIFWARSTYDLLGRVKTASQSLGDIDNSGGAVSTSTTTIYEGSTVHTEQAESAPSLVVRAHYETKNVLGKVSVVTDANGNTILYSYDADGNLTDTQDPSMRGIHIEYDRRGRKRLSRDPDMGEWHFQYDGLDQLISQTDAKGSTLTMGYDFLGRMVSKETSTNGMHWAYDAPGGIGKVAATIGWSHSHFEGNCSVPGISESASASSGRWYNYNASGEVEEEFECIDGETFSTRFEYDAFGRQTVVRYPDVQGTRLAVEYHFGPASDLSYVTDMSDGLVYWAARARNAAGQVTDEATRNGVQTLSQRNASTGWLMKTSSVAHADRDTLIQNWVNTFDQHGNLVTRLRSDRVNVSDSEESFVYDNLDRLLHSEIKVKAQPEYGSVEAYVYDPNGNILSKGGSSYVYNTCGAGPHAVCQVDGGDVFTYDLNGNMTNGRERTIAYGVTNKVASIYSHPAVSQGGDSGIVEFLYGAGDERVVQAVADVQGNAVSRTLYVGMTSTGHALYERTTKGGTIEHVHFIYAPGEHSGGAFALRTKTQYGTTTTDATKYQHRDHLGSITALSDEIGHVVDVASGGPDAGVLGYDAWGARRSPDGKAAPPASFRQQTGRREFTGHETIPNVGLVNMNGRVYDPVLGRFLSADPNVQFSANLQSFNRYSYVLNNPLRYSDPTGYFLWMGDATAGSVLTGIATAIVGVAACLNPVTCVAFMAVMLIMNIAVMDSNGASSGQIYIASSVSLMTSAFAMCGGAAVSGAFTSSLMSAVVQGAVSGAIAAVMSSFLTTGGLPDWSDLLGAVSVGAISAAAGWGTSKVIAVSQASAQGGGGSLAGPRGREPNVDDWTQSGRDPQDPAQCGADVSCVVVHSARGRSATDRAIDQEAFDFGSRETDGFRNARAATVGYRSEYGAEIVRSDQGFGAAATRGGEEYGFEPDLSRNPVAVAHSHISPLRVLTVGDVTFAEATGVTVYALTGRGEFVVYNPSTNTQSYLEYLGRIK